MFPTPQEIGLPKKFTMWRPNQPAAIQDVLDCEKRAKVQLQRAGAGKTVTYVSVALMRPNTRAAILTVNKQLQDQLLEDFGEIGMVDVRGKSSYECEGRPSHTCETGYIAKCPFRGSGICPASAAKTTAGEASLFTTNYACWMAGNRYSTGWGNVDTLILDEAHEAAAQLANAAQVRLSEHDLVVIKQDWPDHRERGDMEKWKYWALVCKHITDTRLSELEVSLAAKQVKRAEAEKLKHLKNLSRKFADLHNAKASNWVCEEWQYGYQFDPIDPGQYAERYLLGKIPNLILTSGTIQPKTVEDLGLTDSDYQFFEYRSNINPARSPLYWLKTLRVSRAAQEWEIKKYLVGTIDQIVEARMDRKGLIHTANFKIRDLILKYSKFSKYFVSNYVRSGTSTGYLVEQFRYMKAPAWFVSPSLGTGTDLPYDQCRVQIIAKLPFGNLASKVEQEREKLDPERGIYNMWQRLGQQFGRGDRAEDDWQEVFVLDDLISWVLWKYPDLAPASLLPYYRPITEIPVAPDMKGIM